MNRAAGLQEPKTLAESVMQRIQQDILECRLKPGEPLRIEKLMDAYQVGMSPLREALSRLASTGLVLAAGQRGFRVAPVSIHDFLDLTRMSVWVEAAALRSAIAHGDRNWEAEILAANHRMSGNSPQKRRSGENRPYDADWDERHRNFHNALIASCDSPRLLAYRDHLYDLHDRYRRLAFANDRLAGEVDEAHKALMKAVLDRDAPLAIDTFTEHCLLAAGPIVAADKDVGKSAKAVIDGLRASIAAGMPAGART